MLRKSFCRTVGPVSEVCMGPRTGINEKGTHWGWKTRNEDTGGNSKLHRTESGLEAHRGGNQADKEGEFNI